MRLFFRHVPPPPSGVGDSKPLIDVAFRPLAATNHIIICIQESDHTRVSAEQPKASHVTTEDFGANPNAPFQWLDIPLFRNTNHSRTTTPIFLLLHNNISIHPRIPLYYRTPIRSIIISKFPLL
jgi:hypothetical protein